MENVPRSHSTSHSTCRARLWPLTKMNSFSPRGPLVGLQVHPKLLAIVQLAIGGLLQADFAFHDDYYYDDYHDHYYYDYHDYY